MILVLGCYVFFIFVKKGSGTGRCLSLERTPLLGVLHMVEGLALVVLCSCRPATRRLAVNILKEVRALHTALGIGKVMSSNSDSSLLCMSVKRPLTSALFLIFDPSFHLFRLMKNWPLM